MKAETALSLISRLKLPSKSEPQIWLDLGAGEGTFTEALAKLLPAASQLIALDQSSRSLAKISTQVGEVRIKKEVGDFHEIPQNLPPIDGLIMANAFHYIEDKKTFIQKWESTFSDSPTFLIIEYDTQRSNPWVPYPIRPSELQTLFSSLAYTSFEKLGEVPSLYHNKIYAAQISKS